MTQAQRTYLAFYPRDKEGEFRVPARPRAAAPAAAPSREGTLAFLKAMRGMMRPDDYQAALEEVDRQWPASSSMGDETSPRPPKTQESKEGGAGVDGF
jgi:hypothetical protein